MTRLLLIATPLCLAVWALAIIGLLTVIGWVAS